MGSTIEENNFRSCLDCRNHADFRQVQDPGQGGHPTRPATSHLRWQATRGWPHPFGQQHPEGVHSSSSAQSPWRCKEAQEEGVHHPKEDQAQAQEDQVGCPQVLQGRASSQRVPNSRLRRRCLHGCYARPTILWTLPPSTSSMRLESKAILAGYGWM